MQGHLFIIIFVFCLLAPTSAQEETISFYSGAAIQYEDIAEDLPEFRTYSESTQLWFHHPEGWVLSELNIQEYDKDFSFAVIAPHPVTIDDLNMIVEDQFTFPMMMVINLPFEQYGRLNEPQFRNPPIIAGSCSSMVKSQNLHRNCIYQKIPSIEFKVERERYIAFYTSYDDWDKNQATYTAMLNYPLTLEYYVDPDLRYTLFWNMENSIVWEFPVVTMWMAYPDGWELRIIEEDRKYIFVPENEDDKQIIKLDINIFSSFSHCIYDEGKIITDDKVIIQCFETELSADKSFLKTLDESPYPLNESLQLRYGGRFILPFSNDTERGIILFANLWQMSLSVPSDSPLDDAILWMMIESFEMYEGMG